MPRFIVTEEVSYEVEAADGEEAVAKVIDNPKRDEWFVDAHDRWYVEVPEGQPSRLASKKATKR